MMLFHPQCLEMTLVSFQTPCLRIQAEQGQPQEQLLCDTWPSSYPGKRPVKKRNARDLLTCTDLAKALGRNSILFPLLLSPRHCWLSLPMLRRLQGNLFETWGCFLCKLEERCPRPRERQGALERNCFCFCHGWHWLFSGNFLVCLSSTISQMIAAFH